MWCVVYYEEAPGRYRVVAVLSKEEPEYLGPLAPNERLWIVA